MKTRITGPTGIAVVIGTSMAVFAQTTERPAQPTTSQAPTGQAQQQPTAIASADVLVTLAGCVQREADYRRAHHAGRVRALTGAGIGNKFVLVSVATAIAGATPPDAPTPGGPPAEPDTVGTAATGGGAYELTGPAEGQLDQYVGRRVEIVGKIKSGPPAMSDKAPTVTVTVPESTTGRPDATSTATASPSGRPAPPAGGLVITGQELHLRELEVVSVREASGSCTPGQK